MKDIFVNTGLWITYALFAVAMLALLFFAVKQFATNIGKSKTSLIGILGLLIAFGIAFGLSSGTDISQVVFDKVGTSYSMSRLIGAGLIMTYILFGAVFITLLTVEIMRPFKK